MIDKKIVIILLAISFFSCNFDRIIEDRKYKNVINEVSQLIKYEMDINKIKGLSIGIVDGQKIIWARGFGYASVSQKQKATAITLYQIGSISKIFTTLMTVKMAESGLLDLDKPIQSYVPEVQLKSIDNTEPEITIRQLLTHSAGLPNYDLPGMFTRNTRIEYEDWIRRLNDTFLAYPPGYCYSYSNLGFVLLGYVLQKVAARPFVELSHKLVFKPLKMRHTTYEINEIETKLLAKGYNNQAELDPFILNFKPAASVVSNVMDMCRLIKMMHNNGYLYNKHFLKPESIRQMLLPQNMKNRIDYEFRTGLGWILNCTMTTIIAGHDLKNNQIKYIGHEGSTILHQGSIRIIPERKIGVVVLLNSAAGIRSFEKIALFALDKMLNYKGLAISTNVADASKNVKKIHKPEDFVGHYATEYFGVLAVKKQLDGLKTNIYNLNLDLNFNENGSFSIQQDNNDFGPFVGRLFYLDKIAGNEFLVVENNGKSFRFGVKIKPDPIPPAWMERCGNYEILNYNSEDIPYYQNMQLVFKDGFLLIKPSTYQGVELEFALKPLNNFQARIKGIGSGMGEIVNIVKAKDSTEVIQYSGLIFKKLNI